jgi:hypothetical protein
LAILQSGARLRFGLRNREAASKAFSGHRARAAPARSQDIPALRPSGIAIHSRASQPVIGFADEFRLAFSVLLNVVTFWCAARFTWRRGASEGDLQTAGPARAGQTVCDAFLLYSIIQYVSVALPGIIGLLNAGSMSLTAAIACALLCIGAGRIGKPKKADRTIGWAGDNFHELGFVGCFVFVAAFVGTYVWVEWSVPPVATDSLVYHLPTAVQWLQTGKLGLYPTWYWNPAATYSPATGMTFMAWLIAPMHNDVLVRFVQVPPLLWIFFLAARLCMMMGADVMLAGLMAVAATLCRALFSESIIPKDDLFVTAFVASAIIALHPANLRDRLGPWRAGGAIGMVLASKYTALIVCPIFLFLIDSPFRARLRKRDFAIAGAVVLTLAGPWYLRNLCVTGNPLYPVDVRIGGLKLFNGLFTTERDRQLRSGAGIRTMLSGTYHSLPAGLIVALAGTWLLACLRAGKGALKDPVQRTCLVGLVAVLALFLITSPHHEVRYIFPLILPWFAAATIAIVRWLPEGWPRWAAGLALAGLSTATSFDLVLFHYVVGFALTALLVAAIVVAIDAARLAGWLGRKHLTALGGVVVLALATWTYIDWHAWLSVYRDGVYVFWGEHERALYPEESPVWKYVRSDAVQPGATIAYVHTTLVYPLYGFDEDRRVVYAPVRRGIHDFLQLPRLGATVPGDAILTAMLRTMNTDPDRQTWMENLKRLHADYLVIVFHKLQPDVSDPEPQPEPPEQTFASSDRSEFETVFQDEAGVVYRLHLR